MYSVTCIWHELADSWVSGSDETQAEEMGCVLSRDLYYGSRAKKCKQIMIIILLNMSLAWLSHARTHSILYPKICKIT